MSAAADFLLIENLGSVDIGFRSYISTESIIDKRFKIGLVPTKAAVYSLGINLPSYYIEIEDDPRQRLNIQEGDCREYITGGRIIQVNYGRTNHSLVKGVCKTTRDGLEICYPDELFFRNNGGFAFRVVP